jgi:hypothetical protein
VTSDPACSTTSEPPARFWPHRDGPFIRSNEKRPQRRTAAFSVFGCIRFSDIARECLRETFRPAPAKIEAVLATLGGDSAQDRINYLERNLRLVHVIGAGRDRVKFALDPLAEYRQVSTLWSTTVATSNSGGTSWLRRT